MKKLISSAALILTLGLAACGGNEESSNNKEEETPINNENEEVENNETELQSDVEEISEEQQATIEAFKSNDFMTFAESFYGLSGIERGEVYSSTVEGSTVTWSGLITDLETIDDSIVILGKTDSYNGADWITLNNEYKDLVPYVIIVEMNDPTVKEGLKKGDSITLSGEVGARGDVDMQYNWKLYKGEITN